MKILFVEDNDDFASDLQPNLEQIAHVHILRAKDKVTALGLLADQLVDLVILDLSIPPEPHSDKDAPEHGQDLFYRAQDLRPNTPIFVLTGSIVHAFSRSLAKVGNQVKLWGGPTLVPTVTFFPKEEAPDLVAAVQTLAANFAEMEVVEVNTRGKNLGLSDIQARMLRTFTRNAGGESCDVALLSGGLSDAKVVKTTVFDRNRKPQGVYAGKLGSRQITAAEASAYQQHVRKLGVGACPNLVYQVEHGVGQFGAIFYTLTDQDTVSFFDKLTVQPDVGANVVRGTRQALHRWSEAATADRVSIARIRSRLLDDATAAELETKFDLGELRKIETRQIAAAQSCIHGDLHCGNILVDSNADPVVIDFGEVAPGFTALDPIALELSLVFHPDSLGFPDRDALISRLGSWWDVDVYSEKSDLQPMIVACREWVHDQSGGDLASLACAYAYAMRQLNYETVPTEATLTLLKHLVGTINSL